MNESIIEETGVTSKKLVFSNHVMIIILMAFLLYCKYRLHAIWKNPTIMLDQDNFCHLKRTNQISEFSFGSPPGMLDKKPGKDLEVPCPSVATPPGDLVQVPYSVCIESSEKWRLRSYNPPRRALKDKETVPDISCSSFHSHSCPSPH